MGGWEMKPDYVCYNGCGYIAIEDMKYNENSGCLTCPNCNGESWYIEPPKNKPFKEESK
jgi:hypothetical protein